MSGPPADPQAATADPDIGTAIQRLAFALRVRRFYPADSPVLARKIEETLRAFQAALTRGPLVLEIEPEELVWTDTSGECHRAREQYLADTLHRRCVARLRLKPGLTSAALYELLDDLSTPTEAGDRSGPLLEGSIQHIVAEQLQLEALFAHGGGKVSQQEIWTRVLAGFAAAPGPGVDSWSGIARDVQTLSGFLEWALSPGSQPTEMQRYSQTDAFGLLCEQIVSVAVEDPRAVFDTLTKASASLFDEIDPEAWLEILADPLPLENGEGEAGQADLTVAIGRSLSNEQVCSLIRYALRTRSRSTPRLYRFFDRVLRARPDRESLVTSLMGQIRQVDSPAFNEAWPQFMKVMQGEDIDPYVNADYRATFDEATAQLDDDTLLWEPRVLRARSAEMRADFTRVRKARIALALLGRETDADDYRLLLQSVEETIPVILSEDDFDLLEAIVSTLAQHAGDDSLAEELRQAAGTALAALQQPELIRSMAERLSSGDSEQFHILWRIIDRLGPTCLPPLLDALAQRSSPAYRAHLTRVLTEVAELPVATFQEAITSGKPSYARDITGIIAELRRPELIPLLVGAAEHAQPGVRREAIVGLVRLPCPEAERVIMGALTDSALEVRVAGLKAFRSVFSGQARERLYGYLRLRNTTGRNNTLIIAAIKALAQVADQEALPRIAKLARRPFLFHNRRAPVWREAQRALRAIKNTEASALATQREPQARQSIAA